MALKYGFYDSVDGDRVYSAKDFTSIFNNLITDGVLPRTGNRNQFGATPASSGLGVTIDSGWAWFDSTYTFLTAPQTYALDAADAVLYRWDAVVIQTDNENRTNEIIVVKGTPATENSAVKPTLTANQHPICYAKVTPGLTKMVQGNIENRVGFSDCPWITGIVGSADLTQVFAQWQYDFDEWFDALQEALSGDVAGNLQRQITENANNIDALETAVSEKANARALSELSSTLSAAIGNGGNNCRIHYGTYTGTGLSGSDNPCVINVPFFPVAIFVAQGTRSNSTGNVWTALRGMSEAHTDAGSSTSKFTWGETSVSWYYDGSSYNKPSSQLNENGYPYYYVVIGYTPQ